MIWSVPKIWEGGDVWILGGGPSVPKQFGIPDTVVSDVMRGVSPPSVYSPYMKPIHDCHVIGINAAYLIGDWIDMCFFGDAKFFLPHKERLAVWPGLKVSCHSSVEKLSWVKYLPRDPSCARGISKNPKMVAWNANSGSAAISIAANAGAKRIILLGFDMNNDINNRRHWHSLYRADPVTTPPPTGRAARVATPRHPSFARHLMGFPEIARHAKERGIEILNASPNSAITVFPKYSLKELLFDNS